MGEWWVCGSQVLVTFILMRQLLHVRCMVWCGVVWCGGVCGACGVCVYVCVCAGMSPKCRFAVDLDRPPCAHPGCGLCNICRVGFKTHMSGGNGGKVCGLGGRRVAYPTTPDPEPKAKPASVLM